MAAVTPIAPVNVELPDASQETEQAIEQGKTTQHPLDGFVSILMTIFTWQPCNIRILIKLPSVTNNLDPLCVVRANPLMMAPSYFRNAYCSGNNKGVGVLQTAMLPCFTPNVYNDGVVITYYDAPPLLAILSMMYRKWRGGISFMFRAVANFTNQGIIMAAPAYNCNQPWQISNGQQIQQNGVAASTPIRLAMPGPSLVTMQSNSFVLSDVSNNRHLEVTIPYRYPLPWYDQFQWLHSYMPHTMGEDTPQLEQEINLVGANGAIKKVAVAPQNFVTLLNKASINTGSQPNEIYYELFVKAEPDFEFADRFVLMNCFNPQWTARNDDKWITYPVVYPLPNRNVTNGDGDGWHGVYIGDK